MIAKDYDDYLMYSRHDQSKTLFSFWIIYSIKNSLKFKQSFSFHLQQEIFKVTLKLFSLRIVMRTFNLTPLLLLVSPFSWAAQETQITVYTSQNYPIQNANLAHQIYLIDRVGQLETQFSASLSPNLQQAEKEVRKMMTSENWKQFDRAIQEAYVGVTKAWATGVAKIPAIVFENDTHTPAVIYGETDVQLALTRYEQSHVRK